MIYKIVIETHNEVDYCRILSALDEEAEENLEECFEVTTEVSE